jgi:hypothetical protein
MGFALVAAGPNGAWMLYGALAGGELMAAGFLANETNHFV